MVGLVVIVVIISLIILFVLRALLEKPQQYTQEAETSTLSNQWVDALLRTNSQCFPMAGKSDPTIGDLLIDCAKFSGIGGNIICTPGGSAAPPQKSCEYVQAKIDYALKNTLEIWNIPYEFKVNMENSPAFISFRNVTTAQGGDVTPYTLPLYPTNKNIEIRLCIGGCARS